jgi:hypothetical protein
MTIRGPFKRILDDAECGEVRMDWQVWRGCAGGREAKSNKWGLWPSV